MAIVSKKDNLFYFIAEPKKPELSKFDIYNTLRLTCMGFSASAVIGMVTFAIGALLLKDNRNEVFSLDFFTVRPWLMLALACLIEELTFRAFLVPSKSGLLLTLTGVSFIVINRILHAVGLEFLFQKSLFIACFLTLGIIPATFATLMYSRHCKAAHLISSHYKLFFWLSCLAFALAHISNYNVRINNLAIYIILVAPQFFMGIVLSFIRIKNGIVMSFLSHFAIDALLIFTSMTSHAKSSSFKAIIMATFLTALVSGAILMAKEWERYRFCLDTKQELE